MNEQQKTIQNAKNLVKACQHMLPLINEMLRQRELIRDDMIKTLRNEPEFEAVKHAFGDRLVEDYNTAQDFEKMWFSTKQQAEKAIQVLPVLISWAEYFLVQPHERPATGVLAHVYGETQMATLSCELPTDEELEEAQRDTNNILRIIVNATKDKNPEIGEKYTFISEESTTG